MDRVMIPLVHIDVRKFSTYRIGDRRVSAAFRIGIVRKGLQDLICDIHMSRFRGMHIKGMVPVKTGFRILYGDVVEVLIIFLQPLDEIIHLCKIRIKDPVISGTKRLDRIIVSDRRDGDIRIEGVDLLQDRRVVRKILLLCLDARKEDLRYQCRDRQHIKQGVCGLFDRFHQTKTVNGTGQLILCLIHSGIGLPASQKLCGTQHGKPHIVKTDLKCDKIRLLYGFAIFLPILGDPLCRMFGIFHEVVHHMIRDFISVVIVFQEHPHLHGTHSCQRARLIIRDIQFLRHDDGEASLYMTVLYPADKVFQIKAGGNGIAKTAVILISLVHIFPRRLSRNGHRCQGDHQNQYQKQGRQFSHTDHFSYHSLSQSALILARTISPDKMCPKIENTRRKLQVFRIFFDQTSLVSTERK